MCGMNLIYMLKASRVIHLKNSREWEIVVLLPRWSSHWSGLQAGVYCINTGMVDTYVAVTLLMRSHHSVTSSKDIIESTFLQRTLSKVPN